MLKFKENKLLQVEQAKMAKKNRKNKIKKTTSAGLDTAELVDLEAPSQADFDALRLIWDLAKEASEYLDGCSALGGFANYEASAQQKQVCKTPPAASSALP
jgi:hypothetical protein